MIEPQNTVFPLPAEPVPVAEVEGDGAGFGAMLAQSLGMVSALDPAAVRQVGSGNERQNQPEEGDFFGAADSAGGEVVDAVVSQPMPTPTPLNAAGEPVPIESNAVVEGTEGPLPEAVPTGSSSPVVAPKDPTFVAATPVMKGQVGLASEGDGVPVLPHGPLPISRSLISERPDPASATPVPAETAPPAVSDDTAASAPLPVDVPAPASPSAVLAPEPSVRQRPESAAPAAVPAGTAPPPPAETPPQSGTTLPPQPTTRQPTPVGDPISTDVAPNAELVAPVATAPLDLPSVAASVAAPMPAPMPSPGGEMRVDLPREAPVMLDAVRPVVNATGGEIEVPAPATVTDNAAPPAPTSFGLPTVEASRTSVQQAPAAVVAPQNSALAERVMRAVDLQRTQPPPRSMIVEIPEIEGLRLVVSVRSGGQVSVTQAGGGANADAFTPFAEDLSRVLSERGFVMNGDDRRGRHHPQAEDDTGPHRAPRPTFQRSAPNDNDLRI